MRSDAVATIKQYGHKIFDLSGVDFKSAKVRRSNADIKALFDNNKFLTSTSPADQIQPLATPGQPGPSGQQWEETSKPVDGYLYHPCILRVRASHHHPYRSHNI